MSSFIEACGEECAYVFVESDGAPMLGAMLFPEKNGKLRSSPRPFTMYQGVLFGGTLDALKPHTRVGKQLQLTEFLLAELEKNYENMEFCLHWNFPDIRSFLWFHYHERGKGMFNVTVGYTGLFDLRSVDSADDITEQIRLNRRRELRSADAKGWRIEESTDVKLLDDLHRHTFDRQDIERPPEASFHIQSIARAALQEGFGEMLVGRNAKGEAGSALLALYDDKCGYYLIGANDPKFRKDACGTMLMTESMLRAKRRGCTYFDFVGINSPARGDYKISFNAIPTPYFTVRWKTPRTS